MQRVGEIESEANAWSNFQDMQTDSRCIWKVKSQVVSKYV